MKKCDERKMYEERKNVKITGEKREKVNEG
jgi:hypothetical protein